MDCDELNNIYLIISIISMTLFFVSEYLGKSKCQQNCVTDFFYCCSKPQEEEAVGSPE